MIFCTLPGLYENFDLNNYFIQYCIDNPKMLIDEKIYFTAYGSFPQDPYAGNSVITDEYALYNDIYHIINSYINNNTICRFDCSNLLINQNDYNVFNKITLEIGNNKGNQIEISTWQAYDFFTSKYPSYDLVWSQLTICDNIPKEEILVRNMRSDGKLLEHNKIEYILCYPCDTCSLQTWSNCMALELNNINSFSNQSVFLQCDKYQNLPINYDIINENNKLKRIQIPKISNNAMLQLELYLILIKPEFRNQMRLNYFKNFLNN